MNFSNEVLHDSLRKIDPAKLLILDLGDFEKNDYSFVCQDFGKSVYACLTENFTLVKKYRRFVLFLPDESEHPKILLRYFKKFTRDNGIEADVIKNLKKISLAKDTAYLVIQQNDLVEMVKRCRKEHLTIGKDIGLIAYNDTPIYEIIESGITVISTDFEAMGQKAAEFVNTRERVKELIPARMIVRGSL
jgi:DNA-binding LacI/PurR family transcriptional regulator